MEIYQLKYFEATARTGSIGAAAKACQVRQPTLSVQIKSLEEELGHRLFDRHARGVKLTRAGNRLLNTAQYLLAELDQLRQDFDRRNFASQQTFRIGIQPFLASEVLAKPLQKFVAAMSYWRVTLRERPVDLLLELLLNRQVDACLMGQPVRWPAGLNRTRLFSLPFVVYCRKNHPLATKGQAMLGDALPYPLLLWNDPTDIGRRLQQLARMHAMELNVVFTSDLATTAFAMATEGAGVAILPDIFASRCERVGMKRIPLGGHNLASTVYVVWRRDTQQPDGLEKLTALCRENSSTSNA